MVCCRCSTPGEAYASRRHQVATAQPSTDVNPSRFLRSGSPSAHLRAMTVDWARRDRSTLPSRGRLQSRGLQPTPLFVPVKQRGPPPLQNLHLHRNYQPAMREVFAHYATLELRSSHLCDWAHCEHVNRTISREEFIKFLTNFEVCSRATHPTHITAKLACTARRVSNSRTHLQAPPG
jgi:hypothetical protein